MPDKETDRLSPGLDDIRPFQPIYPEYPDEKVIVKNPASTAGRWLKSYTHKLASPVEEAWYEEEWAIPKTALAAITVPFNLIPAAITTSMGYDKAENLWAAADEFSTKHKITDTGRWGLEGLALGADFYLGGVTDPLRFVSFKPSILWKTADQMLKAAPEVAGLKQGEKLAEMTKYSRMGAEVTEENVRGYVAPKMISDNLANIYDESRLVAEEHAGIQRQYGDYEIWEHYYGAKKNAPISPGRASKSMSDMQKEARLLPFEVLEKEHGIFNPELIKNPSTPLEEKLAHIANHEEFLVKGILKGAPATRIHFPIGLTAQQIARNVSEGIPIGPSPIHAIKKGISRVAGTWKEQGAVRKPIEEVYQSRPQTIQDFSAWVNGSGYRTHVSSSYHPGRMNAMEVEQILLQEQAPWRSNPMKELRKRRDFEGVISRRKDMIDFIVDEVNAVPDHFAMAHLKGLRAGYEILGESIRANPQAVFASNAKQVDEGLKIIDEVIELAEEIEAGNIDPDTLSKPQKRLYDAITSPQQHEFRINRLMSDTRDKFKRINDMQELYHKELQAIRATPKGTTPNALAAELAATTRAGGVYDELPALITSAMRNYQDLMTMTTSFNFAMEQRNTLKDIAKYATEISNLSFLNHEMIRDHFVKQASVHTDIMTTIASMLRDKRGKGKEILNKMANIPTLMVEQETEKILQQNLLNNTDAPIPRPVRPLNSLAGARAWAKTTPAKVVNGVPVVLARTATDVNKERAKMTEVFNKYLGRLEKRGVITSADSANVQTFMGQLDNESFANLIFSFQDLAKSKAVMSFESALLDRFLTPVKKGLEGMEKILNQEHAVEKRNLSNKFAAYQAHYSARKDPLGFFQWLTKPGGFVDLTNDLIRKVSRKAGYSADAVENMQKYQENHNNTKPYAEAHGIKFSKDVVVGNAEKVNPAMRGKITLQTEYELNEAVGDYVQYYYTPAQFTAKELAELKAHMGKDLSTLSPNIAAKVRQLTLSEQKVQDGLSRLETIFGDRVAAENFAEMTRASVGEYYENNYIQEAKLKIGGLYKRNYVPYRIEGDPGDKKYFRDLLSGEQNIKNVTGKDKILIARSFGPSEHRYFFDVAALQDFINETNKRLVAEGKSPLKLYMESHLSAVIGERKKIQLQALNNRQLIDVLEANLPAHMRVIYGLSDEGKKYVEQTKGWKNVGELIPSMEGKFIREELYDYLNTYVPKYDQENKLFGLLRRILNGHSRINIMFSPVHMKNVAALAYVAGMDWRVFSGIVSDAIKEQHKFEDAYPGGMNLMKRIGLALEESELYKQATRSGVTHFRGEEQFSSVGQNIKNSMAPKSRLAVIGKKGAFGSLIFDVMDRATKMTVYKKFSDMGAPARQAADWTNHYLIDYTGKNLDPNFRKMMHSLFPFVSWRIGNALLHIPEMIENPRKYATIYYLRDYFADYVLESNPFIGSDYPEALAYTMPLPTYDANGNQIFVDGGLPWETDMKLINKAILKNPVNPVLTTTELAKYVADHSFYGGMLRDAMTPNRMKELKKENIFETMFAPSNPKRHPEFYNLYWGIAPAGHGLIKALSSAVNEKEWRDFTPFLINYMVGRAIPVTGAGKPVQTL